MNSLNTPYHVVPRNITGRSKFQIVLAMESSRLASWLVATDIYICPSESGYMK